MTDEKYREKAERLHRQLNSGAITYHKFLSSFARLEKIARKKER
jgi:hypothetical protein